MPMAVALRCASRHDVLATQRSWLRTPAASAPISPGSPAIRRRRLWLARLGLGRRHPRRYVDPGRAGSSDITFTPVVQLCARDRRPYHLSGELVGRRGARRTSKLLPLARLLVGEANDYVGKGLSGGKLIVRPRGGQCVTVANNPTSACLLNALGYAPGSSPRPT